MSKLHLENKIAWQDLMEFCRVPDPSTISLQIGECNHIHIPNAATRQKVEERSDFININEVCEVKTCKVVGTKIFSKGKINLFTREKKNPNMQIEEKFINFLKKLVTTILDYSTTDEIPSKIINQDLETYAEDVFKNMELDSSITKGNKNFKIVLALFLECDLNNLLTLHDSKEINISEAFGTYSSAKAITRCYSFLMDYHVIPFYLVSNAIIAANYQKEKSEWGLLNPENNFYKSLLSDSEFLRFIPSLRQYLAEDIFMVDLEKTDFLLKEIFKYICVYTTLCQKATLSYDEIFRMYKDCIWSSFKLHENSFKLFKFNDLFITRQNSVSSIN